MLTISLNDSIHLRTVVEELVQNMITAVRLDQSTNGFKIFYGSNDKLYTYHDVNKPYVNTRSYTGVQVTNKMLDQLGQILCEATESMVSVKICRMKERPGIRIRFATESSELGTKLSFLGILSGNMNKVLDKAYKRFKEEEDRATEKALTCLPSKKEMTIDKKDNKEMKDFSLTNLKDALVNKITSLDKKTITILAIIGLLLLIAGKYQDIKDIVKGIANKVKRSKNFKAMVEDGTNAINGLKKIVGIKEVATDET